MDILVVDIENGNIDSKRDPWHIENCVICEIGIAQLDLDTGRIKPIFCQICREDNHPDPNSWVFQETSLTCEEVSESNHFNEFKDELQKLFDELPVTSWGHDFDLARLEHPSRGLVIPTKFWDPKTTLTDFLEIPSSYGYGYKWPKVTEAYEYFYSKKMRQTHRAVDDALVEAEIIIKAIEKWPELKDSWEDYLE